LLDNWSDNSNAAQRIAVLEACLAVLGRERIGLVPGDRESVGHSWLKYLKDNGLNVVMRLPRHHLLTDAQSPRQAIADLGLAVGQVRRFIQWQVDGVWGKSGSKHWPGASSFSFLAPPPDLGQLYARR